MGKKYTLTFTTVGGEVEKTSDANPFADYTPEI